MRLGIVYQTGGSPITIAGVTGARKILSIAGTTVTLASNADATVAAAAVVWSAPVWKAMAVLAA